MPHVMFSRLTSDRMGADMEIPWNSIDLEFDLHTTATVLIDRIFDCVFYMANFMPTQIVLNIKSNV